MDNAELGLTGFGFWVAIATIVIAAIWAVVKNQQMKHELKLKLLERGQGMDPELVAKLLASDNSRVPLQQKSLAEQHRDSSGVIGLLFLVAGLIFAFVGLMHKEPHWPLVGLGVFSFAFGWLCWINSYKEYLKEKAEEKAAEKPSRD
jgi:hypothetical protein